MDDRMRKWIEESLSQGYTPAQIRESLTSHGLDPSPVDEYFGSGKDDIPIPERAQKDVSNIYAFVFALASVLVLLLSPLLPWISVGDNMIRGYQTPFGISIFIVSGTSLALAVGAKMSNRKLAFGIIALSVFAVGIMAISLLTQVATANNLDRRGFFSASDVSASLGTYIAMLGGVMSAAGGAMMSFRSHDRHSGSSA